MGLLIFILMLSFDDNDEFFGKAVFVMNIALNCDCFSGCDGKKKKIIKIKVKKIIWTEYNKSIKIILKSSGLEGYKL